MRLGHVPRVVANPLARDLERAGTRAPGRIGAEDLPRLSPPGGAVVRLEAAEAARVVHDRARAFDLVCRPGERIADAENERGQPECGDDRDRADEAANDLAPSARDEALDRDESHEREDDRGADHDPQAEQGAVGDTIRTRAAVLDEGRARERPPGHEDRGAGRKQRLERRLDPPLAEPERESDNREPGEEAGAGLGQEDHERGRIEEQRPRGAAEAVAHRGDEPEAEAERSAGEEGERVPVADRSLQSCDAPRIVRAERRDRLAEERPEEDSAEQGGEEQRERAHGPPPGQAGGREADDAEGEEDDSLGERIPGAVARDRPPHGQPGPRDERDHGRSGNGARAIEAGKGHEAARPPDDQQGSHDHGSRPERCRRPRAGRAAGEERPAQKDGGGREHGTGET